MFRRPRRDRRQYHMGASYPGDRHLQLKWLLTLVVIVVLVGFLLASAA